MMREYWQKPEYLILKYWSERQCRTMVNMPLHIPLIHPQNCINYLDAGYCLDRPEITTDN